MAEAAHGVDDGRASQHAVVGGAHTEPLPEGSIFEVMVLLLLYCCQGHGGGKWQERGAEGLLMKA